MTESRIERMQQKLQLALQPQLLEIEDDSHLHAGHAGARGGAGHYTVRIVSPTFAEKALLERHRMIYDALKDMMHSEIHALSIKAHSPDEL